MAYVEAMVVSRNDHALGTALTNQTPEPNRLRPLQALWQSDQR